MTPRPLLGLASLLLLGACAATPPPVAVETPYGVVRAETEDKAEEVAVLLEDLAPRVQEVLPGTSDRPIDVWVQKVLRDGSHGERAEGVKGFTLLSGDFHAKRIHLLEDGELSWYLAHELVHAELDSSWRTLPGLLEEGLGDVVAEMLNEEHAERIRAHRLFTSSGFFGGVLFHLAYQKADAPEGSNAWIEAPIRIEVLGEAVDTDVNQLLSLSRHSLRKVYREVPEPFYGLAYLVVSRIVERQASRGSTPFASRPTSASSRSSRSTSSWPPPTSTRASSTPSSSPRSSARTRRASSCSCSPSSSPRPWSPTSGPTSATSRRAPCSTASTPPCAPPTASSCACARSGRYAASWSSCGVTAAWRCAELFRRPIRLARGVLS